MKLWNAIRLLWYKLMSRSKPPAFSEESDNYCKEDDGCPTELAVLQRFWRGQPIPDAHYPKWFKNEKGCSAQAQVHIEHYFPKGYNPDVEPWKSIKAFYKSTREK